MEPPLHRSSKNYDYLFKIILIGDCSVGKTSILARFVGEEVIKSHISTIGIDFKMKCLSIDGKQVKIQVWDTAGQERYETITTQYYRRAQGIILAYDITRQETFNNVRKWLRYVEEFAEQDIKLTLIGNKSDLTDLRSVSPKEAEELAQEYSIPWFETSAYTGDHVEDAFITITKQIYVDTLQSEEHEKIKRIAGNVVILPHEQEEEEKQKCNC